MSTFGYYPGPIDYWMLVTDWRNGSIAIMLAIGSLIVGYAFRTRSPVVPPPPTAVLPTHGILSSPKARFPDAPARPR